MGEPYWKKETVYTGVVDDWIVKLSLVARTPRSRWKWNARRIVGREVELLDGEYEGTLGLAQCKAVEAVQQERLKG